MMYNEILGCFLVRIASEIQYFSEEQEILQRLVLKYNILLLLTGASNIRLKTLATVPRPHTDSRTVHTGLILTCQKLN